MKPYTFRITPYDLAFLAVIFIGLTYIMLLWFTKSINRAANHFLGLGLLAIVLWATSVLGKSVGLDAYFPYWSRLPLQFSLALGPLIYFYILKISRPGYKLGRSDLLHFIPSLLQQGILVLEIGQTIGTGVATYNTPLFKQMSPVLNVVAFISVFVYLCISFRQIEHYYQQLKFNNVNDRYRYQMRWLHRLMKAFGLLWLCWVPYTLVDALLLS